MAANLGTTGAIEDIVALHVEETGFLWSQRRTMLAAPHIALRELSWHDDRIAAHLDGLSIAGDRGWAIVETAVESPSPGAAFTMTVRALEEGSGERLTHALALARALPEIRQGVLAAWGWVEPSRLQGAVAALLGDADGFRRLVAVAACAQHGVDPGIVRGRRYRDEDPAVRARVLRAAGELGCAELMPACAAALGEADAECRFWGAWSAVLFGDRSRALNALKEDALPPGSRRRRAFRLALQAANLEAAHRFLQGLARTAENLGWLIEGSGIVGDPAYVPWLINHMSDPRVARLAGEAFSLVTGVDLDRGTLDRAAPEGGDTGPNDDPDDPNVNMDPDEGLPWPDPVKVQRWWDEHASQFTPGQRYFMGAPVTREHCIAVLENGYQRQRILAAHHLCLLAPGTPLFNTSAPAWRQQRLLAGMH